MNSFCFALIIQEFNVDSFLGNVEYFGPCSPMIFHFFLCPGQKWLKRVLTMAPSKTPLYRKFRANLFLPQGICKLCDLEVGLDEQFHSGLVLTISSVHNIFKCCCHLKSLEVWTPLMAIRRDGGWKAFYPSYNKNTRARHNASAWTSQVIDSSGIFLEISALMSFSSYPGPRVWTPICDNEWKGRKTFVYDF